MRGSAVLARGSAQGYHYQVQASASRTLPTAAQLLRVLRRGNAVGRCATQREGGLRGAGQGKDGEEASGEAARGGADMVRRMPERHPSLGVSA